MAADTVIPPPPRRTGDAQGDLIALYKWAQDFYAAAVTESRLLDPSHQATPVAFSATNLPDPGASSIATATAVALAAYRKAFGL